jgi:hypothetical protein
MSADQEKMDILLGKIDELLSVLRGVSEDLKSVSASLKSLAVSQITSKPSVSRPSAPVSPTRTVAPPSASTSSTASNLQTVEDVRMMFPEDLDSMLSFEEKGDYIMIKPKQFLGSENFARIASTVRGIGGEYISAGRDSHFRVYKK